MNTWREYFKNQRCRGVIKFIEQRWKPYGVEILDSHVLQITKEEMLDSFLSIPSMCELERFQETYNKKK